MMNDQGLDDIVAKQLCLDLPPADLSAWEAIVQVKQNPENEVNVAMVGKYVDLRDSYISLSEALLHGGIHTRTRVNIHYIESQHIEEKGIDCLQNMDGIVVPGGFGDRGIEGKIETVRYARENQVPYLGICLGMQVAIIEAARNLADLADAHSTEFERGTPHPVIALVTEWQTETGEHEQRNEDSDLGGSMRLGSQRVNLLDGSLVATIYDETTIYERHRHRYEVNNNYRNALEKSGIRFSGLSVDNLVEMIEVPSHPWFIGSQFHPEFTSNPRDGHPLFAGFIVAAKIYHNGKILKVAQV
jgi:CTP synthase